MIANRQGRRDWRLFTPLLLIFLLAACVQTPAPQEAGAEGAAVVPAQAEGTQPSDVAAVYGLPDLGGRVVVAVTGNDYVPLNYVDPLTGESEGWEYDAVNEICR